MIKKIFTFLFFLLLHVTVLEAIASSVFWTYCTTDVYPEGTASFEVDNYFTIFNRRKHGQILPTDIGLDVGLFNWKDFEAEAGFDYLCGEDDPLYFNAKIGIQEDKLFKNAPSLSWGLINFGTRTHTRQKTNQNVVNIVIGKSLPEKIGGSDSQTRFFLGYFSGGKALGRVRLGVQAAFVHNFKKAKDCNGEEYYKWQFAADYASGNNRLGGYGFALQHYFTPKVNVQIGPTFFNTAKYNGKWKLAVFVTVAFPVKKEKSTSQQDTKKQDNNNSNNNNNHNNKDKKDLKNNKNGA